MKLLPTSLRAQASTAERSPWFEAEFVDCYVGWREESSAVRVSYDRWRDADREVEPFAWAAYVAALDREEHAADAYRECAHRFAAA